MSTRTIVWMALAAAAALGVVASAAASGEGEEHEHEEGEHARHGGAAGRRTAAPAVHPAYAKECGACHLAYPPDLLPAASWRRILSGLERHFGQNAELDEATRAKLERWLTERAGRARGGEAAGLRISEAGWFRREHREVAHLVGKGKQVATHADCAACHPGAAGWDFDEDRVRIGRE